jgi:hypothetical protein
VEPGGTGGGEAPLEFVTGENKDSFTLFLA